MKIYSKALFGLSFIPLGLGMFVLLFMIYQTPYDSGIDNMGWVIPFMTGFALLAMSLSKPDEKQIRQGETQ